MLKHFSYCFEPNKITLHGLLERATVEELLLKQREGYAWHGQWSRERAWESLAQWISQLLEVTTHKQKDAQELELLEQSDPQRLLPSQDRLEPIGPIEQEASEAPQGAPFIVNIQGLERIDSSGWAALLHLLDYLSALRGEVRLTGLLSHHRVFIKLYQLEGLLLPYLSSCDRLGIQNP